MKWLIILLAVNSWGVGLSNVPSIYGTVYLDDVPYEGAKVEIKDSTRTVYLYTFSGDNGRYFIEVPFADDWWIHCRI